MENKEEIEKAKERIKNSLNDIGFATLYSQEQNDEDEKILLQYIQELEQENNKQNKIIDEMAFSLADYVMYYNYDKCRNPEMIKNKANEVKQYFEKKVDELNVKNN